MAEPFTIINSVQLGNLAVPGVYIDEPNPTPSAVTGPPTNVLGVVGTVAYGLKNIPVQVTAVGSRSSSGAAVTSLFGRLTSDNRSLVDAIVNGAAPEANSFWLLPVSDGTDTAAAFQIVDNTGFATGTVTASGVWTTGKALSITVDTQPTVTYVTGTNGDTNAAQAMSQLLALFNASAAVVGPTALAQPATLSGLVLTITALAAGAAGNGIALVVSGAGPVLTPSGLTLVGGSTPGVLATLSALATGSAANSMSTSGNYVGGRIDWRSPPGSASPSYTLTMYTFNGQVEVFSNLVAYASPGAGFSAAAFKTSLLNAVNAGSLARAPSAFWAATAGLSTAPPLTGTTFPSSGGTDGAAGVTIATQFGQDGSTGRAGLYGLRGLLQGGLVMLAGMGNSLSDLAFVQTLDAFCLQEDCNAIFSAGPAGTTPTVAIANLSANNANTRRTLPVLGEPYFVDSNSGLQQLENPSGAAAGLIASLAPWVSPLNKPKIGVIATEWTVGQFPDETLLQTNGIGYFKKLGSQIVFYGKTMGDGVTPIEDARMLTFIAPAIAAIGNRFIGLSQPAIIPNATMNLYAVDIKAFLNPMTNPASPKITSFSVDLSPNTLTTITQHVLLANLAILTLSSIWYVLNILQVGNSVQVQQSA